MSQSQSKPPLPQPFLTTQYPTREVLVLTAPDFVPMSIMQILQAAGIDTAALPKAAAAPAHAAPAKAEAPGAGAVEAKETKK